MSKWQEKRLGDIFSLKYGKSSDKMILGSEYKVFSSSGLFGLSSSKLADKGIIVGRKGSVGSVFFSRNPFYCIDTTFYIDNTNNENMLFIYYYLKNMKLNLYNSDAAVPGLNKHHLERCYCIIPVLSTQEKIADILSTYDDLIENNNRRIGILEQMAQEIYKEWFVRFRFPGHEKVKFVNGIPEGWEVKKVKDIVDRKPFGTLYKESQVQEDGKFIVIDQSKKGYIGFHNNKASHNADINKPMILFGDHSCKYKIMIRPFSLAENVIPFTSNDENLLTTYYLFYSINGIVQTTEYKRHWTDLTNKKIIISNINLQTKFEEKIKEFLLEIEQLSIININLIKQRDLLLPRLMSGKLEV